MIDTRPPSCCAFLQWRGRMQQRVVNGRQLLALGYRRPVTEQEAVLEEKEEVRQRVGADRQSGASPVVDPEVEVKSNGASEQRPGPTSRYGGSTANVRSSVTEAGFDRTSVTAAYQTEFQSPSRRTRRRREVTSTRSQPRGRYCGAASHPASRRRRRFATRLASPVVAKRSGPPNITVRCAYWTSMAW